MAKVKEQPSSKTLDKPKKKRPNVHSKKTTSVLKTSKNWKKLYRGQGK